MKITFHTLLALMGGVVLSVGLLAQEQTKDDVGKKIFTENKCQSCHSIEAVGIKKKPNQKPPDLSAVGAERKAEFLAAYLKKKETLNNAKHMVSFKGSDEDLGVLSTWLESLKGDSAKPSK